MEREALGARIKQARKDRGLTGEQLAEVCHVHPTYIRQLEKGTKIPSVPMLVTLCNGLGVSPHSLLLDSLQQERTPWPEELSALMQTASPSQIHIILAMLQSALRAMQEEAK